MEGSFVILKGVEKHYGPERVLGPLSLSISAGEVVGLIGKNGAGKSTLLRLIAGVEKPDAGEMDAPKLAPGELGYVPQELALYDELTARQNLRFWATAAGLRGKRRRIRVKYLLELVGLTDRAGKRVRTLSGGMKRRLNLACALVGEVRLLLLDEPTVGADDASRTVMLDAVKRLAGRGCTVVIVSHLSDDIEQLGARRLCLDHGRIAE